MLSYWVISLVSLCDWRYVKASAVQLSLVSISKHTALWKEEIFFTTLINVYICVFGVAVSAEDASWFSHLGILSVLNLFQCWFLLLFLLLLSRQRLTETCEILRLAQTASRWECHHVGGLIPFSHENSSRRGNRAAFQLFPFPFRR